jgi:hypothetical protein
MRCPSARSTTRPLGDGQSPHQPTGWSRGAARGGRLAKDPSISLTSKWTAQALVWDGLTASCRPRPGASAQGTLQQASYIRGRREPIMAPELSAVCRARRQHSHRGSVTRRDVEPSSTMATPRRAVLYAQRDGLGRRAAPSCSTALSSPVNPALHYSTTPPARAHSSTSPIESCQID